MGIAGAFLPAAILAIALVGVSCDRDDRAGLGPLRGDGREAVEESSPFATHDTLVRIDTADGDVQTVLETGPDPLHLVVASGHVWVQNFGNGTLTHVDPANETASQPELGEVAGIASDGRDLWVARDRNILARVDGASGKEEKAFKLSTDSLFDVGWAGFVATGGGSVWVTIPATPSRPEQVWRIDPRTGRIEARIPIGTEANPPFAHGRHLWVITRNDDRVRRIDMRTNEAMTVPAERLAWSLVAGGGSLWMSHHGDPKIVQFRDLPTRPVTEYPFPTNPRGMAYEGGTLWVATEDGLYSVSHGSGEVTQLVGFGPFPADTGPIGLAVLDGSAWISIE